MRTSAHRGAVDLRAAARADQRRSREAGRDQRRMDPPADRHPRAAHRRRRRGDVRPGEGSVARRDPRRPASRPPTSASSSSARPRPTRSSRAPPACCRTRSARPGAGASISGAACSGFTYALTVGMQMVATGAHDHALVVGADTMSSIIDYRDRTTCILFGDGAGAVVLSPAGEDEPAIIDFAHEIDGSGGPALCMPAGGSRMPASHETVDNAHALREAGRPGGLQVRGPQDRGDLAPAARAQRAAAVRGRSVRLAPGQPPHHQGRGRTPRPARRQGHHQPRAVRQHHRRDDSAGARRRGRPTGG